MSRYDELRAQREARFEAKTKRALGSLEPKPVTENSPRVTEENSPRVTENVTRNIPVTENVTENINALVKRAQGRPRKSDALSAAERQRRRRAKIKKPNPNLEPNKCPPI